MSQPAASAMLKEAEARLGVALFHRHRTGVVPTAEAEPVLRRVRFLLGEVQGLTEDLLDSRRRRPLVRIGAVPHAMLGVMQEFAAHWSGKEGVRLRLEDGTTSALVEKAAGGPGCDRGATHARGGDFVHFRGEEPAALFGVDRGGGFGSQSSRQGEDRFTR